MDYACIRTFVLFATRPLDLSWAPEHIPAIMNCYFGATESRNAVADLLVGAAVPGGKLQSPGLGAGDKFPSITSMPIHISLTIPQAAPHVMGVFQSRPLYPCGYGFSDSTFSISDLHLQREDRSTGRLGSLPPCWLPIPARVQPTKSCGAVEHQCSRIFRS